MALSSLIKSANNAPGIATPAQIAPLATAASPAPILNQDHANVLQPNSCPVFTKNANPVVLTVINALIKTHAKNVKNLISWTKQGNASLEIQAVAS